MVCAAATLHCSGCAWVVMATTPIFNSATRCWRRFDISAGGARRSKSDLESRAVPDATPCRPFPYCLPALGPASSASFWTGPIRHWSLEIEANRAYWPAATCYYFLEHSLGSPRVTYQRVGRDLEIFWRRGDFRWCF